MARDTWGRDVGDLPVNEMARQMNAPATNEIKAKTDKSDIVIERLYETVNKIAVKLDSAAATQAQQATSWSKTLIDFVNEFKKERRGGDQEKQTTFMEKNSNFSEKIWNASQSQNTFWVGICKFSTRAQRQISKSIRESGCCGAVKSAVAHEGDKARMSPKSAGPGSIRDSLEAGVEATKAKTDKEAIDIIIEKVVGEGSAGDGVDVKGADKIGKHFSKLSAGLLATVGAIEVVAKKLANSLDIDPFEKLFKGLLKDSNAFIENTRAIIHETQGFGKANKEIEEQYTNIHGMMSATGRTRAENQKILLKNLERGFELTTQEQKLNIKGLTPEKQRLALIKMQLNTVKSIQTSALATATNLHMDAESLNELFMDWHMHLGLSSIELGEMGRTMQGIARSTGMTGSQLEKALKSTDSVIKSLKKAGIATAESMKKVTQAMASAQKYGVGDQMAELLQATASASNLIGADPKLQLLLRQAARRADNTGETYTELRTGTLQLDPEGMKKLTVGMDQEIKDIFAPAQAALLRTGALKPGEELDTTNLSKYIQTLLSSGDKDARNLAMQIQMRMERQYGKGVGDMEQIMKSLRESSMTTADRVAKLHGEFYELDKTTGKFKEKLTKGTDEYDRALKVLTEAQTNQSMDAFGKMNKFSDELKANLGKKLPDDLRDKMLKELKGVFSPEEAQKFIDNMSTGSKDFMQNLKKRAAQSGYDEAEFNKILEKHLITSMDEAQKGLEVGNKEITDRLQSVISEISVKEKVGQDPITKLRYDMAEWNDAMMEAAEKIRKGMTDAQAQALALALAFADLVNIALVAFTFALGLATIASTALSIALTGIQLAAFGVSIMSVITILGALTVGVGLLMAGIELWVSKIKQELAVRDKQYSDFVTKNNDTKQAIVDKNLEDAKKIQNPNERLKELQRQLEDQKIMTQGAEKNLKNSKEAKDTYWEPGKSKWNPWNYDWRGVQHETKQKTYETDLKNAQKQRDVQVQIEKEISELTQQATEEGSLYVHDIHVEEALKSLLKNGNKFTDTTVDSLGMDEKMSYGMNVSEIENIMKVMKEASPSTTIDNNPMVSNPAQNTLTSYGISVGEIENIMKAMKEASPSTAIANNPMVSDPAQNTLMSYGINIGEIENIMKSIKEASPIAAITNNPMLKSLTDGLSILYNKVIGKGETVPEKDNKIQEANALSLGLFDKANVGDAMFDSTTRDLNAIIARNFGSKKNESDVSTNPLDYRDEMRGEVGTLLTNRDSMQGAVEQRKYGDLPSGSSGITADMDEITNLTSVQVDKLTEMISILRDIREYSKGQSGTTVIGKNGSAASKLISPSLKNIGRDSLKGYLDLTFGDFSAGEVTTVGR